MHGEVAFAHFEGERYRDPDVRRLLGRIEASPHAHQPRGMDESFQCDLTVVTSDGERFSAHVEQPLRGPQNLAPPDRLQAKFFDCAARALRPDAIGPVYAAIGATETFADVRQLTQLLADAVRSEERARSAA